MNRNIKDVIVPLDLKRCILWTQCVRWRPLCGGFIAGCIFATVIIKWSCCWYSKKRAYQSNVLQNDDTNYSVDHPDSLSSIPLLSTAEEPVTCISHNNTNNDNTPPGEHQSDHSMDDTSSCTNDSDGALLSLSSSSAQRTSLTTPDAQQRQRQQQQQLIADQLHQELMELIRGANVRSVLPTTRITSPS